MTKMIEVESLVRSFGQKIAVNKIQFQVEQGEIFGFLGPNGAGKTTTIRMLTGQIDPTEGNARVAGFDIIKQRQDLKTQIGVVFEHQNLYERQSARQNLEFSCELYNVSKTRIDEVLEIVSLRDRAKDPVRTFSNGMKQRVMIARALLHQPKVLFLDEPGRGLDPIAARDVRNAIRRLADAGMTVLLTTHLMEEADQLCKHVAFIVNGKIVANDTPDNLKSMHTKHQLQVTLLDPATGTYQANTLHINKTTDQQKLAAWLQQGNVQTIQSIEATLEDVFIRIAGTHLI